MLDGSAWEPTTAEIIAKISTKDKYMMKRIGAKAAKAAERFESKGEVLNGDEATTFRALAARANYLAPIGLSALMLQRSFVNSSQLLQRPASSS